MNALLVVHASMSVQLKQSAKAKSIKLILNFALIVDHVLKYVPLMQYHLRNKDKLQNERLLLTCLVSSRFFLSILKIFPSNFA